MANTTGGRQSPCCCVPFVAGKRSCSILVSHFGPHLCMYCSSVHKQTHLLTSHTNYRVMLVKLVILVQQGTQDHKDHPDCLARGEKLESLEERYVPTYLVFSKRNHFTNTRLLMKKIGTHSFSS